MTHTKVLELANKFANQYNKAFQDQRERLETFFYDSTKVFKSIINEMNGDLLILKHKDVHEDVVQMFGNVIHNILSLYLDIDPEDPYIGIENLINWVEDKQNKILLENLEFLIDAYLNKEKVDFEQGDNLKHPQVHSIRKFLNLIPKLRAFMNAHPMLPNIEVSTIPSPLRPNKDFVSLGPEDATKILPVDVEQPLKMPAE